MLGGSEIATHSAQHTAALKDDGATPLILFMIVLLGLAAALIIFTNLPALSCIVLSALLSTGFAVPYALIRRRKRLRILEELRRKQMEDMRNNSKEST